jgi:hypothetical protein
MRSPLALAAVALAVTLAGCTDDEPEVTCPAGQTNCGGVCFDLQNDPLSCGSCLRVCAEGASCLAGACSCPAGDSVCDGACVNLQTSAGHCGACGHACGLGTCTGGGCACTGGATDCNGSPACVDLLADEANCGACGERCVTRETCAAGVCGCPAAYPERCPTYCANLASTTDCGVCGNSCAAGGLCDTTQTPAACDCPGTEIVCGATGTSPGTCVDISSSEAHCGVCGRRCATSATCTSSSCLCPTGTPDVCGNTATSPGACVDRQTDEGNCGTCGRACQSGATCEAGSCVCPAERPQACGGTCCAGDQCCGTGGNSCQPPHDNGLGGTYYSGCDAPYAPSATTKEAARRAADAWAPGLDIDGTTGCDVLCLGRQTANSCAVWCYGFSSVAGRVGSNMFDNNCAAACPSFGSPAWN